jgi:hypothetical protein
LFTEKAIGALGRGSTYKENMIQCIGNFKKLAAEVVEEAIICNHARQHNMSQNLEIMHHNALSTHSMMQQGLSTLQSDAYAQKLGDAVYERVINQFLVQFATNPAYDHPTGSRESR